MKCPCCDDVQWLWLPDGYVMRDPNGRLMEPTGRWVRRDEDGQTAQVWA